MMKLSASSVVTSRSGLKNEGPLCSIKSNCICHRPIITFKDIIFTDTMVNIIYKSTLL